MISLESAQNIQKISFLFFIVLGLLHLLTGLAGVKGYFPEQSLIANRVLFIPFVLSTLSYAGSSLKANLLRWGKTSVGWDYLIVGIVTFILAALIAIEFIFPDKIPL